MKLKLFFIFVTVCVLNLSAQPRSLDSIFPGLSQENRRAAFEQSGFVRSGTRASSFSFLGSNNAALDPQITNAVLSKNPLYLVEAINIIPVRSGSVSLLDVYNALGNIRGLSGRLYNSATRNEDIPLFTDATRLSSSRRFSAIPDPPPARFLPSSETVYIRLRDANFGNTFYKAEMSLVQNGLRYTLSNNRNITYLFVPVIREEKLIAQLYIEPIAEGILIYSIAGVDVSDFFASRISINSAIAKRLAVFTDWASDGISK